MNYGYFTPFSGEYTSDLIRRYKQLIKEEINKLSEKEILNPEEHSVFSTLKNKYKINMFTLKINEGSIFQKDQVQYNKFEKGMRITHAIPFNGDPEIINLQPMRKIGLLQIPEVKIEGSQIMFQIVVSVNELSNIGSKISTRVQILEQNVENIRTDLQPFILNYENEIHNMIEDRKRSVIQQNEVLAAQGFKINSRADIGTTVEVDLPKSKKEEIKQLLKEIEVNHKISEKLYNSILDVIISYGSSMENTPETFAKFSEEELRDILLANLNSLFPGAATGETFNKCGKTDIIIKHEDTNLFIAECLIWNGKEYYKEKIDQLLGYVKWRDIHAAIIVFNKQKGHTDILKKINASTLEHNSFKEDLGKHSDYGFKYKLINKEDDEKIFTLTVLAFHFPKVK